MMKIIGASALALALGTLATPALAADGNIIDGFGALSAGVNSLNPGSYSYQYCYDQGATCYGPYSTDEAVKQRGLDVAARISVAVPVAGKIGAQVDGEFARTVYRARYEDESYSTKLSDSTFAAHLYLRDQNRGLIGVVAQRTTTNSSYADGISNYYVGGEAQAFLGRTTLYGQLTYTSDDTTYNDANGVNAAVQLRFFPQDNLKLVVRSAYERVKYTPDWRFDDCSYYCYSQRSQSLAIGVAGEYRLASSPLSLTADADYRAIKLKSNYGYNDREYYNSSRATYGDLRVVVGLKLNFGASSLFERDRAGASLDPVRPLGQHAAYVDDFGGFDD